MAYKDRDLSIFFIAVSQAIRILPGTQHSAYLCWMNGGKMEQIAKSKEKIESRKESSLSNCFYVKSHNVGWNLIKITRENFLSGGAALV